jgi:hypothetical protein
VSLANRSGIEVRGTQLVSDVRLTLEGEVEARAEDVRQALDALREQGYAERRNLEFSGWVWKVMPEGFAEAERL